MGRLILNTVVAFLIGIFILCCSTDSATAQEHIKKSPEASELDDILKRFDDQPSNAQENKDLENVLEGFDDGTEAEKEVNDLDDVLRGFEEDKGAVEELTKKDKGEKTPFWELSGSLSLGFGTGKLTNRRKGIIIGQLRQDRKIGV